MTDMRNLLSSVGHRTGARRGVRWAAGLACLAVVVAGCGTVPGAAASVAGTTVSVGTIQDRAGAVIAANTDDDQELSADLQARVARDQLTTIIRHRLIEQAAADRDIDVADADVHGYMEQFAASAAAASGVTLAQAWHVPADDVPDAIYDALVLRRLTQELDGDGTTVTNVTVTIDAVPAADRATAVADRITYLDDPAAMTADAEAARAQDPRTPGGQESLVDHPGDAVFGIFSAPEGSILLLPHGDDGYLVTRITERQQGSAPLTSDMVVQMTQARGQDAAIALASLLLGTYANDTDVTVNPRFGFWDPRVMRVVAPDAAQ